MERPVARAQAWHSSPKERFTRAPTVTRLSRSVRLSDSRRPQALAQPWAAKKRAWAAYFRYSKGIFRSFALAS